MQVRIFADLLHRFTVGDSQPFLDDQCAQRDPGGLGHGAVVFAKLLAVGLFDIRSGNLQGQDDPAIVTAESAAKGIQYNRCIRYIITFNQLTETVSSEPRIKMTYMCPVMV